MSFHGRQPFYHDARIVNPKICLPPCCDVDTLSAMSPSPAPLTVSQAAAELGVTPAWVRRLCDRHNLGTKITDRMRLLSHKDLRILGEMVGKPPGPVPEKKSAK